jgi:ppGpp synthetase/RelA/SpoT-type nucleotidyltranferase
MPDDADRQQGSSPTFDYAGFLAWYEKLSRTRLEPARQTFVRILDEHLDRELSDFDRYRVRISASRVKQPLRVWAKMQKPRYAEKIKKLTDIPAVIDDLVGIRIVCNNLSDIEFLKSILDTMPTSDPGDQQPIAIQPGSQKYYQENPKPSGYRAYHVNLVTIVPGVGEVARIVGELQARTLLQDGWGELTHEDTYKPGVKLPPLVETLAKRMADLLATVDDLAQDVRDELDRLAQTSVEDSDARSEPTSDEATASPHDNDQVARGEEIRPFVLAETARIVSNLERPAPLASIAARLRGTFGAGLLPDWVGYGNFKSLLVDAVPDISIQNVGPGYVIPRGATPSPEWPKALLDILS